MTSQTTKVTQSPRPILSMNPEPTEVRVSHFRISDSRVVTAIFRRWEPGQAGPAGRCKLCPTCTAYADACLIQVGCHVSKESARAFSTLGHQIQPAVVY